MAFEGKWNIMEEYANPQKGARLFLNFNAKEVFLVMNAKYNMSKVKVFLDGKQQSFGQDVVNGVVTVTSDTLYKLINLKTPGNHNLILEFEDDNTELYAFTFG